MFISFKTGVKTSWSTYRYVTKYPCILAIMTIYGSYTCNAHIYILPLEQRLCSECGVVENEVHFLCDCVRYSSLREDLFSLVIPYFPEFSRLSSREKFIFFLQTEYTCILKAIGSFVYKAFKLHH